MKRLLRPRVAAFTGRARNIETWELQAASRTAWCNLSNHTPPKVQLLDKQGILVARKARGKSQVSIFGQEEARSVLLATGAVVTGGAVTPHVLPTGCVGPQLGRQTPLKPGIWAEREQGTN